MTAVVLSVEHGVGDRVSAGDEVIVLESMKMEIPIVAEADGVVAQVLVSAGTTVNARDLLAVIDRD
ncbi:biotin/lipoyl-containing protein [Microbacterium fluvii]|uniref:Biotin/lipoyl-containing protein n=1 Tax=Microbacterium fluvii TaxID=415215 RepID=A0ABW2HBZ0_9MICO|nr:biotin/lipoyl-containing protein [Microbacterium fluvii]MCU4671165.1 biotin/lipoyl-binding protein [Microbacterium fluvii]